MTKHERIVGMLLAGMTDAKVALKVGCRQSYVRAVRAREWGKGRKYPGYSGSYNPARRAVRYATDPAYREHVVAKAQKWRAENRERYREICRDSYHRCKARAAQAKAPWAEPSHP